MSAEFHGGWALYSVSAPRIKSGGGLAHSFALRLPSDGPSRFRPCLRLVLMSMHSIATGFRYRGLLPHKFTPVPARTQPHHLGLAIPLRSIASQLCALSAKSLTCMHGLCIFWHMNSLSGGKNMRTTLNIEDQLIDKASKLTGIKEKTMLVKLGLEALIARESGKRLAKLGGTEKGLKAIPRRRFKV
jgi:hypothetical protein